VNSKEVLYYKFSIAKQRHFHNFIPKIIAYFPKNEFIFLSNNAKTLANFEAEKMELELTLIRNSRDKIIRNIPYLIRDVSFYTQTIINLIQIE